MRGGGTAALELEEVGGGAAIDRLFLLITDRECYGQNDYGRGRRGHDESYRLFKDAWGARLDAAPPDCQKAWEDPAEGGFTAEKHASKPIADLDPLRLHPNLHSNLSRVRGNLPLEACQPSPIRRN